MRHLYTRNTNPAHIIRTQARLAAQQHPGHTVAAAAAATSATADAAAQVELEEEAATLMFSWGRPECWVGGGGCGIVPEMCSVFVGLMGFQSSVSPCFSWLRFVYTHGAMHIGYWPCYYYWLPVYFWACFAPLRRRPNSVEAAPNLTHFGIDFM